MRVSLGFGKHTMRQCFTYEIAYRSSNISDLYKRLGTAASNRTRAWQRFTHKSWNHDPVVDLQGQLLDDPGMEAQPNEDDGQASENTTNGQQAVFRARRHDGATISRL